MKTAIYVRSAIKNNKSIHDQEKLVRQSLGKRDKVYRVYKDNGYAGTTLNRPGLRQLLSDATDGKFQGVAVDQPHRLSRSTEAHTLLQQRFKDLGIIIKCKSIDSSSATGRVAFQIFMGMLDIEKEMRISRISPPGQKNSLSKQKKLINQFLSKHPAPSLSNKKQRVPKSKKER